MIQPPPLDPPTDERRAWWRWAVGAGLGAVLLGGLIALPIRHSIRRSVTVDVPPARLAPITSPAVAELAPEPEQAPAEQSDVAPARPPLPPPSEALVAGPGRPAPPGTGQLADAREAILQATPEALVKGKPIPWSAGTLRGYVVPSERQDYDARVCRNIYATTIDGQQQRQGTAQRWCRPADGKGWAQE